VQLLERAAALMDARPVAGPRDTRLVVFVDELADLIIQAGKKVRIPLERLLQRGRDAGIHIIAATQRPSAAYLSGLMRANFPLRLVGKVVSTDDAKVAAGRGGTQAHLLMGKGDFLAVSGGRLIHFQVATTDASTIKKAITARWSHPATPTLHLLPDTPPAFAPSPLSDLERLKVLVTEKGQLPRSINEAGRWLDGSIPVSTRFYEVKDAFVALTQGDNYAH
jgi:DNA segregation ATPase FtsK/SpoIIIE-like protein